MVSWLLAHYAWVKKHMHERLVGWEEGLAGYWPMDECFGRTVKVELQDPRFVVLRFEV